MPATDIGKRELRMAMIGGGPGALIGETHRRAARLDGRLRLVAGSFSSDPAKSREQGEKLFLDPARAYGSWKEMLRAESAMPADKRIDLVSIVTPNHLHLEQAAASLAAGFHVVLDKPMTLNLAEARRLHAAVEKSGRIFALTHTYTGYSMVKLARDLVKGGRLGKIRKIMAEYPQGWLYRRFEDDPSNKQASWRTDPARSGSGCLGDIGTHAANLTETVSGLRIVEVAAEISTLVGGRRNDDDLNLLVRWENGAKGVVLASQVATGEENDVSIRVYGDQASLEWRHGDSEHLRLRHPDRPMEIWSRGAAYVAAASPAAARNCRLAACHPEGMIEAFANIYANVAEAIVERGSGKPKSAIATDFPDHHDGLRGMLFVDAALASARAGGKWTRLDS
ncbi:MAG: Gfo/Idh/MocA family oxidoreductase [Planctomycetota bacterium]|jgi:predicted dehydrogenase|nr:Gfo/Idh/MocA family oxidoreductase [Planctomycetota bacterium]